MMVEGQTTFARVTRDLFDVIDLDHPVELRHTQHDAIAKR